MASKHQLSLELPESNNIKVFRVFDTSIYAEGMTIDCTLRITSPGFNLPVSIETLPNFNLVLSACSLGLQRSSCGENFQNIPDGIYIINYSVSPNSSVFVEYNYLRTAQTMNQYYNILASLELAACDPEPEIKEKLAELRMIKSFIEAAKGKVEYAHEPEAGMELFSYAKKRLSKLVNSMACYT
jgi:hypothetical protein